MRKIILFFILLFVFANYVYAVAPITTIFMGDEGLELESPSIPYVKLGTSGTIIVHVFNKSNGVLMESPDVSCFGTHNLPNGTDIASQLATPHDDHFHFNWNETSMPIIGLYSYTMHCNTSTNLGGYLLGYMQVTESGQPTPENRTLPLILAFIAVIIYFTFFGFKAFQADLGKASFWFSLLCFGIGLVELVFMVGVLFINEYNVLMIGLLKINFYMISIIAFGLGIAILSLIYMKWFSLDKEDDKWQVKKW